jgi:hypothetical protein
MSEIVKLVKTAHEHESISEEVQSKQNVIYAVIVLSKASFILCVCVCVCVCVAVAVFL